MALLLIILAAFLGGGTGVLIKIALAEIPPLSFTFIRFLTASLFIIPLFLKEKKKKIAKKDIFELALVSLLAVSNVTFFAYGVRFTSATVAQTLYTTVPIVAAFLSYLILKEKITVNKIFGVLLGLLGTIIIIVVPALGKKLSLQGSLGGNLLIIVALVSFSFYSIFSKKLQKKYSPIYLTTAFVITTTVVQLFLSASDISLHPGWWQKVTLGAILATLYVAIVATVIYYILYQYAIKHGGPIIASLTLYLQPVATYLWAAVLLKERLTLPLILGAILIFFSAWLVTSKYGNWE